MIILTHRGLDPDIQPFPNESSREAFISHLGRGYGLEFDIQVTPSKELVVSHDMAHDKNPMFFSDLLDLITESQSPLHALHYKGHMQNSEHTELIANELLKRPSILDRIVIFDLLKKTAEHFKKMVPLVHRAASVAHPFDIKRFNDAVHHTLFTLEEVIALRELYDWVWLDEWDTNDENGMNKQFYTASVFHPLRTSRFSIALVTPELHARSPGLLGGEAHTDGAHRSNLISRLQEIIALDPDAICTDHPDLVKSMTTNV